MLSKVLKDAKRRKYKILYVTVGANTNTPKLLYQQLPRVLRDSGIPTLAVHIAPVMHESLHVTDSMAGDVSSKKKNKYKTFVSTDKKLRVHYLSMFMKKRHVRLLSEIVRWRSKNKLVTVIGDFLLTGPYAPFTQDLTTSLKPLLHLRYVYTIPSANGDKGVAKSLYKPIAHINKSSYVSIPQQSYKYRFHINEKPKPRLSHHRSFVNITGSKSRNGYVSISRSRNSPISLSP